MAERAGLPLWAKVALPLVVVAVALLIGSGVFDAAPESASQRVAAIETTVRCPACEDISVAQSDNSTAIAVRHQIQDMVADGSSTADIDSALVSEYGPAILLVPPDAGGVPLIWVIPLVFGLVVVAAVGIFFWRRGRAFGALRADEASGAPDGPGQSDPERVR
jgi:cytochrome c-type biogenesis protein CcmH